MADQDWATAQERRRAPKDGPRTRRARPPVPKERPRYLLMRAGAKRVKGLDTGRFSPLQLEKRPEPKLPTPEWVRVRPLLSGICGSDLGTLSAENSPYFSPITSPPFVLGHEVLGEVVRRTTPALRAGERVVVEPALGCAVRGIEPPCAYCASGRYALCVNVAKGDILPGIQTGFCGDTGGGWSEGTLVAHPSQLHRVPDEVSDEAAVADRAPRLRGTRGAKGGPGAGGDGARDRGGERRALRRRGAEEADAGGAYHLRRQARAAERGGPPARGGRGRASQETYAELPKAGHGGVHAGDSASRSSWAGRRRSSSAWVLRDDRGRAAALRPRRRVALVGMPGARSCLDLTALWHKEVEPRRRLRLRGRGVPGREG